MHTNELKNNVIITTSNIIRLTGKYENIQNLLGYILYEKYGVYKIYIPDKNKEVFLTSSDFEYIEKLKLDLL